MIDFGGTIRKFRNIRKITQTDLAESVNITSTYLSAIENNRKEPSFSLLNAISKKLRIPKEILIWDAVKLPEKINSEDHEVVSLAKDILNQYLQSMS